MNERILEKLELNKILKSVSSFAVLQKTKSEMLSIRPQTEEGEAEYLLNLTAEADLLLYRYGVGKIEDFGAFTDELERAQKGSALSCKELLSVCALLRSARIAYKSVASVYDEKIVYMREIADRIYFDTALEDDIQNKIVSEDEVSDYASDALYTIRRSIRSLNEKIRAKLSAYLTGGDSKYLQDGVVTMRDNRYVLPVRAEYKSKIKGFVHDRSQSGATFFIEPEYVLELNNELRTLMSDEKEEVERILLQLSNRVGAIYEKLKEDIDRLSELDRCYAKAEYSYKNKCVRPRLNARGVIDIVKGRHPLLDAKTAIPVSVSLGDKYDLLLISGPNTGGKTVTLKMCGLFCLMACCGIFIPASGPSTVAVFENIFCDIGDSQSIEENLSTFSSHVKNVIEITENADKNSLVLIDELGGGTDPDEGQAIAKAVISYLLSLKCKGIITTHYSSLKEFAYSTDGIENASMEFDMTTLQPLYRISIGLPGSSNAIAISRRLGLKEEILSSALANLSEGAQRFENIVRQAELSRVEADAEKQEAERLKREWNEKVSAVDAEREKLKKEREKLYLNAKVESRRIINEKTETAEELLAEIEKIASSRNVSDADLIRARTLKNKLADQAYANEAEETEKPRLEKADLSSLRAGDTVYVGAMQSKGEILSVDAKKKRAEVRCGNMRLTVKAEELYRIYEKKPIKDKKQNVQVVRKVSAPAAVQLEINLLGKTVMEAVAEVDAFIDRAVLTGLEEVKIIHGVGTGKLKEGIRNHLRGHKNVGEFRSGVYGEGEAGVTIVKLK